MNMRPLRLAPTIGLAAWLLAAPALAQLGFDTTIRRTAIATGFTNPVDIVAAPGDMARLFIVEQPGRIRIIRDGLVVATPFLDVSSKTTGGGEQGLLGLAFHPNYASNRRFFVFYTRNSDGALIIERYERSADHPERVDFASGRVLLAIPHAGASNHNGGKLAFRSDGYLYIGTGDGGGGDDPWYPPIGNGQNFGTRLGKMLRVDVNVETAPYYAVPPGNPYAGMTCNGAGTGTCPEIWALGLRNPYRFSFDRLTADMFIGDVGQGAREEVDYEPFGAPGGRNYGWKIREGLICRPGQSNCTVPPNYVEPILDYNRGAGVSITGGFRYRGTRIAPLYGAYLYADFGSSNLWGATVDGMGTWTPHLLLSSSGVSSFGEDNAGELYFTGYFNGTIYRIDPVDTDADLLPDWWETTYFGSATAGNASVDTDGDGASNLAEYLAGTDPLNALSVPPVTPFVAPEITSANALVCVVGSPCALGISATGTPQPTITRTGTLPAGLAYNAGTRTISGTPSSGTIGSYPQTIGATNGTLPNATQALTIVVAAGCGGFTDVTGTDSYCNSVEWLRNRSITTGCTAASQYCPGEVVTRASMALFQHRLGGAITPLLGITERTEAAAIDNEPIVCAGASDLAPVAYPRNVQAFFSASVETTGALTVGVTLVASRNAGATWEPVSLTRMRAQTSGAAFRSTSGHGVLAVNAGDAVRFGLSLHREGGTASVNSVRCQVAWIGVNRDGAAPPRDTGALQP